MGLARLAGAADFTDDLAGRLTSTQPQIDAKLAKSKDLAAQAACEKARAKQLRERVAEGQAKLDAQAARIEELKKEM